MSGVYPAEYGRMPEGDNTVGGVFSELNRKKWWIIIPTLLALVGAVIFVNVVKPKYTGEARVLLENRDNYFTRPDKEQRGTDPPLDSEAVQSQVQTVMSRDIAKAAIRKLDLANRDEFDPVKKEPSVIKRILALIGLVKDPLAVPPEERILENYFDKLLVYNVGKSRVIAIEFSSRDPELAAKGANLIADEYIGFQRDAKKSTTQGASAWLAQAIEPMRARVAEAEAKVEAFRAEHGLLIGASNATIATQQLGEMNTQMSTARALQSELNAKARNIREALRTGRIFETSEVVNNELVRRLLEQRVSMKTQIALEERTLLPGHPRMKELTAQLSDLENQIRTAAERAARTLENDARIAGARVQNIQAEFEGQKRTAASANEQEVQLRALEREAKALRENYEQYLSKYRDSLSRDADAASPADARIISRAVLPQLPAFPKKVPIILLATLATMVLSSAIIITRFLFASDIMGNILAAPVADAQATPVAQVMPVPPQQAEPVAPVATAAPPPPPPPLVAAPARATAPAQQTVQAVAVKPPLAQRSGTAAPPQPRRTPKPQPVDPVAVLEPLVDDLCGLKQTSYALVIGCQSFGTDVQSVTTALPLGRALVRRGTTVLVDLTGRNPDAEQAIGRFRAPGLGDMLAGSASFADIIHRDRQSRLHVIPYGGVPGQDVDVASPDFAEIIDALGQTYDFVLVDAGPLSKDIDLAAFAGAMVLVASKDDSDPAVRRAFEKLDAALPGRVTIVVEEPSLPTPSPANDTLRQSTTAA